MQIRLGLLTIKRQGGGMVSGASSHYKTMSVDEMALMPVNEIADDNCILFMWWVASQPVEAIKLASSWGFKIKTMTGFNWIKLNKERYDGLNTFSFGMGFWTRAGSECCLIATKGKPKRLSASIRSVVLAERLAHSKKPDIFRDKIVSLCGDLPRVELFARNETNGWDVFGNEVDNSISLTNPTPQQG